jgi:hypothetical protein
MREDFTINNDNINFGSKYILKEKLESNILKIEYKENNKVKAFIEIELKTISNDKINIIEEIIITSQRAYKKYQNELEKKLNTILNDILINEFDNLKIGENYCGIYYGYDNAKEPRKVFIHEGDLEKYAILNNTIIYKKGNILFEAISLIDHKKKLDGFEEVKQDLKYNHQSVGESNNSIIYYIGENFYYKNKGEII